MVPVILLHRESVAVAKSQSHLGELKVKLSLPQKRENVMPKCKVDTINYVSHRNDADKNIGRAHYGDGNVIVPEISGQNIGGDSSPIFRPGFFH